jgi:hypothetical protein
MVGVRTFAVGVVSAILGVGMAVGAYELGRHSVNEISPATSITTTSTPLPIQPGWSGSYAWSASDGSSSSDVVLLTLNLSQVPDGLEGTWQETAVDGTTSIALELPTGVSEGLAPHATYAVAVTPDGVNRLRATIENATRTSLILVRTPGSGVVNARVLTPAGFETLNFTGWQSSMEYQVTAQQIATGCHELPSTCTP